MATPSSKNRNFRKLASLFAVGLAGVAMLLAFQNFAFTENRFYKFVPVQGEDWPEPGDGEEGSADAGGGGADPALYGGGAPDMSKIKTNENGSIDPSSFKDLISFGTN